jgi:hypothetical protein
MVIHCDNTIAINISKNLVQHSSTKHIDIRHHFIRDLVESWVVSLSFLPTNNQLCHDPFFVLFFFYTKHF